VFPLFVAHVVFWVVLLVGSMEIGLRASGAFVLLWVAGYLGSGLLPNSELVFVSYVALLDIVLVLMVFKGDVRLQ
jgi:hypothetical protein